MWRWPRGGGVLALALLVAGCSGKPAARPRRDGGDAGASARGLDGAAAVPVASGSHQAASMRCGPASRVSGPWYSGRWRCTFSRCGAASSQVG